MKIKIKFMGFFIITLFCFLCYISIFMTMTFEIILPLFGLYNAGDNFLMFFSVFLFSFVSAATFISAIFVKPLLLILSVLKNFSENQYDLNGLNDRIYNKKGNIKKRYFLFKETIKELSDLSFKLILAEKEREQLEQSKKDWIRGISHDLKTPLSYILGYSALLSNTEYNWKPEEQQKFLAEIYSKSKYIEDLIGDLRLSFEIENPETVIPLSCTNFDLIPFLQNIIVDVANSPKATGNNFNFQTVNSSVSIYADKRLIYRAFQNLLINSVIHNPPQIDIAVSVLAPHDNLIKIKVIDNGIGLNETEQAIFADEISYQKGWNGLSIVKNIILAHNGKITLDNKGNKGTTFIISLPIKPKNIKPKLKATDFLSQ